MDSPKLVVDLQCTQNAHLSHDLSGRTCTKGTKCWDVALGIVGRREQSTAATDRRMKANDEPPLETCMENGRTCMALLKCG
jgi:hypothetical protein